MAAKTDNTGKPSKPDKPDRSDKLGERRTTQREAITEAVLHCEGPLTVRELHERAAETCEGLGIATVYRTVNLLLEQEKIRSVILQDGETRYESAELGHHHHFRCRACGQVYDLPGCAMPPADQIAVPNGFTVEDHEVTLLGTCAGCGDATQQAAHDE